MKNQVKSLFIAIALMAIAVSCGKEPSQPTVAVDGVTINAESSNVTSNTATISGKLTVESEGTFSKSAVLYYSSTASTLEALKSSGTKKTLTLTTDGTFSYLVEVLERETKYYCAAVASVDGVEFSSSVISFTTLKPSCPSGAVDLGLSVCWATCNLGASKPEDYGGYYQWAGLQDVTDTDIYLNWYNCPYHIGSSFGSGWKKYVPSGTSSYWSGTGSPDNKTVLDQEDDVAHVKLGGKWRMPTKEEWNELRNTANCSWTWTTINGIEGYKVQSKKTGCTDNWIFLPAAGYRDGDDDDRVGSYGYYWSSSLNTGYPYRAHNMRFNSDDVRTNNDLRYRGQSVRPVSE